MLTIVESRTALLFTLAVGLAVTLVCASSGCKHRSSQSEHEKPTKPVASGEPLSLRATSQPATAELASTTPCCAARSGTMGEAESMKALRQAVARDPGLDSEETLALLAVALDAIDAEFRKQPCGEFRFESMASQLADVYECLGVPLWFDLRVTDERSRLALAEAYFHFQGSTAFEKAKLMDRQSSEFKKRYIVNQPEAMSQNLRLWLDILIARAGDYSKWAADIETIAKPLGLPTDTRADALRTALELLKQRKLPRGQ